MKSHRATAQLDAVLRAVDGVRDHPTAQQVFGRVRRELPQVSLGTVYRNLDKLTRDGRVRVLRLDSGARLYDTVERRHDHFVCERCGVVIDIDVVSSEPGRDVGVERHRVLRQTTQYYGVCAGCADHASDFAQGPPSGAR